MMAERLFGMPHPVASMVMATVSLSALPGVVVGAAPATGPSAAAAASGEDSGCLRPLPDVIWGFLVTLFACAVAAWGSNKYTVSHNETGRKVDLLLYAVFPPMGLLDFIGGSYRSAVLIWRYNRVYRSLSQPHPFRGWYGHLKMLWSWVSPFSKSIGRMLFCCDTVVYVRKESPLLQEEWLWESVDVKDFSEAMVIGEVVDGMTQTGHYERKQLSYKGKAALMLAGVVPKYDELKFLRGNSGFAIIALAIQALGYIYATIFRVGKDLPVAPLEVIGLILNIILLIEVSVFSFFNPCYRPLVIYINSWREQKVIEEMGHVEDQFHKENWMEKLIPIVLGMLWVGLVGIVVYFIVSLSKVSSILVVVPLIIFVVANIMCIIYLILEGSRISYSFCSLILKGGLLLSVVAYAWAFVVTIVYWDLEHFNARAELLNVSQLIPFIG